MARKVKPRTVWLGTIGLFTAYFVIGADPKIMGPYGDRRKQKITVPWIVDSDGRPTTDTPSGIAYYTKKAFDARVGDSYPAEEKKKFTRVVNAITESFEYGYTYPSSSEYLDDLWMTVQRGLKKSLGASQYENVVYPIPTKRNPNPPKRVLDARF